MLNLLLLGAKHCWKFKTVDLSPVDKAVVNWDRFVETFQEDYVPLVERDRLDQEYLSLRKTIEMVTEITRMFHERGLFFPEQVSTEQDRVSRYLVILRRDICDFVANTTYQTLAEL